MGDVCTYLHGARITVSSESLCLEKKNNFLIAFFLKMQRNELYEIFCVLRAFYGTKNKGKTIHEVSAFTQQLNILTYLPQLNDYVKVFKEIHIRNLESLDPYSNASFSSTLVVFSKGEERRWLVLKESSIKNSGLGVFAVRTFKADEFVTCYLGIYEKSVTDLKYQFLKINGGRSIQREQFAEDYWFGHRIQHGSGEKVNVTISEEYVIKTTKKVTVGEELFLDYNRDISCLCCKEDRLFDPVVLRSLYSCSGCSKRVKGGKKCSYCNCIMLCYDCYDKTQI